MRKLASLLTLAVCLMLLTPAVAPAEPIQGTLNIFGNAQVAATTLTFLCDVLSGLTCPADYGAALVTGPSALTGSFVPLAGSIAYIHNLNSTDQPVNDPTWELENFITFDINPNVVLDLQYIFAGTGGPCPPVGAAPCTPRIPAFVDPVYNPRGLSPFNLANTPTGSAAAFSVAGETRNVATGETSPFNGVFTAQFTNTPGTTNGSVEAILTQFATQGSITTSYSATFASAIPEPATTSLLLGGLLIFAGAAFRRRMQASKQ